MPTYVTLLNFTDQGIKTVKDTVQRVEAATALGKRLGTNLKETFWTLGPYDVVAVIEAPDDETATRFALAVGSQGNVRTLSMRAFGRDEMTRILAGLP